VTWTEHGLAVAREGYGHLLDVEDRYADELGAERFAWLRDALARMTAMLEDDTSAGPLPEGRTI